MHLRPAIFLDRDGTLNRQIIRDGKPYPPLSLQEFELLDGVQEACDRLSRAGYALVVATNQPDVARGTQTKKTIESMHARLLELIPSIERIEVCYAPGRKLEHPENHRRKPAPGMLLEAASALQLDLPRSWMIGDRAGDVDAGYAAGCHTIFIDWNYQENPPTHAPHHTVKSLREAAGIILAHR